MRIVKHAVPPLPYDVAALEPYIDARTLLLHHDFHHAAYVAALGRALETAPPELRSQSAGWLLCNLGQVPENLRVAVRNNAGGHVNHSMLWRAMSPRGGDEPSGPLAEAVDEAFGSFRKFRARFEQAGSALFGSGWVWLVRAPAGELQVMTTPGHDNPVSAGLFPILLNDTWEHAYYLQYENRRPDYLKRWWAVVDWSEAARRFARVPGTAPRLRARAGVTAAAHAVAVPPG